MSIDEALKQEREALAKSSEIRNSATKGMEIREWRIAKLKELSAWAEICEPKKLSEAVDKICAGCPE